MNEITKHAEQRRALQWLAQELAWERTLATLRSEDAPEAARAA